MTPDQILTGGGYVVLGGAVLLALQQWVWPIFRNRYRIIDDCDKIHSDIHTNYNADKKYILDEYLLASTHSALCSSKADGTRALLLTVHDEVNKIGNDTAFLREKVIEVMLDN